MGLSESFLFERDFMEDGIRCIPMAVRLRLDLCGIKLKLSEWSKMTETEKRAVANWPCKTHRDMDRCRNYLKSVVLGRTGREATILSDSVIGPWADTSVVPEVVEAKMAEFNWTLSLKEWRSFTELQRFALVKLTRPGHENRNFPHAVMEFRGRQLVPVI